MKAYLDSVENLMKLTGYWWLINKNSNNSYECWVGKKDYYIRNSGKDLKAAIDQTLEQLNDCDGAI
jgi:hypothetical protein